MNVCVLNLLLPTTSEYALVSTGRLNLLTFFEELTTSLSKAILKYENLLIMGDFNIDMKSKSLGYDKLDEFCDLFIDLCLFKKHM